MCMPAYDPIDDTIFALPDFPDDAMFDDRPSPNDDIIFDDSFERAVTAATAEPHWSDAQDAELRR